MWAAGAKDAWEMMRHGWGDSPNGVRKRSLSLKEPAVLGAQPQPLQPNVVYRLFVAAGRATGQHDFKMGGRVPEAK